LREYLKVLSIFKTAIMKLEYEKQPTVSWIYGIVDVLRKFLRSISSQLVEIQTLRNVLLEQLEQRFEYAYSDPIFIVSAYIDPATSRQLNPIECAKASKVLIDWVCCLIVKFIWTPF
jgi:uncharacterized protein YcbK (DUF882 family)